MKKYIIVLALLFSNFSFATGVCEFNHGTFLNTKFQTGVYQDKTCFVTISNIKNYGLVYRSHSFMSTGQHQIFNSFGPGPSSTETGARVFFYLVDKPKLKLTFFQDDFEISFGPGLRILFDGETTTLSDKSVGIMFDEERDVNKLNSGGVEVTQFIGNFLDFGFQFGASPLSKLTNTHLIVKANNTKCQSENSKLLEIKNYDIFWKYTGFKGISKYIDEACPE